MPIRSLFVRAMLLLTLVAGAAPAQESPPPVPADTTQNAALRAYLDCNERGCDSDFIKTELTWVNWMRDRLDADFHILVTAQQTGSGGSRYVVVAIGQRAFQGQVDTLEFTSQPNDTGDDIRRSLLRVFGQLLLPHAAKSPLGSRLTVLYAAPSGGERATAGLAKDRWNFWTYSVSGNAFLNGESARSVRNLNLDLSANRTTAAWKIRANINTEQSRSKVTYDTGTPPAPLISVTDIAVRRSSNAAASAVKSVSEHLSVGGRGIVSSTVYNNLALATQVSAAVEWDYYPYSEFTRRKFTVLYTVGVRDLNYNEETIYFKTEETRPVHTLDATFGAKQTWGEANVTLFGSQYLDELKYYNAGLRGNIDVNLGKGISFDIGGQISRVRNQLYLPSGGQTPSQVLQQLRSMQTNYRYFTFIGLQYRFGSIFNSVVNPRFGNIGNIDDF